MPSIDYPEWRQCSGCGYDGQVPRLDSEGSEDYSCADCGSCLCGDCWSEPEDDYPSDYDDDNPDDGERESDTDDVPSRMRDTVGRLYLPSLPGRPIRLTSFEQEIGGGAYSAAIALCGAGFAPYTDVASYGSSSRMTSAHREQDTFVHVEDDSSCGGEIVYSRLDLNSDREARRVEAALGVVRDCIDAGDVYLNASAGFHVHVDVRGFGMRSIENLYHVHNHLEEILYRIGSAGWRGHRSEMADNDYAPTVRKGLSGKAPIGQWLHGARAGLNLSNYLGARGECHCGAFAFDAWEECSCDLPKPTCEFRWANATANLRKVHAFAALTQSLIACAHNAPDGAFANLAPLPFGGNVDVPARIARVQWMTDNLTMTGNEWASVAYCLERAPFGDSALSESLAEIARNATPAVAEMVTI